MKGKGRLVTHECTDAKQQTRRQRLALGSVQGIHYLDALCLHCGAHLIWVEDGETSDLTNYRRPRSRKPTAKKKP